MNIATGARPSMLARTLMSAVRGYQLVPKSGLPRCRFFPSCSDYAFEAIERHGAWRGLALSLRRVATCHPFHPGGIDLVPEPRSRRAE